MIKAYHTTDLKNFKAISRDGFIRPRGGQTDKQTLSGRGFKPDWVASDNQFVYFAIDDFYMNLQPDGTDASYGFIFDAAHLIREFDARVGPDLMVKYDELMHEIAKEVDATLPKKDVDVKELQAFFDQHGIEDPGMQAAIRKDESENYYDLLYGMLDQDTAVPGVKEGLKRFSERIRAIQAEYRVSGDDALRVLETRENPIGTPLEILVSVPVPISEAIGNITKGKEILKNK